MGKEIVIHALKFIAQYEYNFFHLTLNFFFQIPCHEDAMIVFIIKYTGFDNNA